MLDLTKANQSGLRMSRRLFLRGSLGAGLAAASAGIANAQTHFGEVQGLVRRGFEPVRDVIAASLAKGGDIGCSAAVFIDGEPVVDIWGGFCDPARTRAWEHDTIVNTFSSTKTMTALAAMVLVDRGVIDLDAPVARYWPEFARAGKGGVKVRHLLSHMSGVAGWTEDVTVEDLLDREKSLALLERQEPWWTPGEAVGYHPITYGPLIGEVIRRTTGQTLGQFFADEVCRPMGGDFHIGTGPELDHRVSMMFQSNEPRHPSGQFISDRAFFNPYITPQIGGSIAWRRAELGGSNGHGSAYGMATIQSVVSCGGEARGVRLLRRETVDRILEVQADQTDLVAGYPLRWGLGYALENPMLNRLYGNRFAGHRIAFWGGSGGSIVVNDLDERMTITFAMNKHVEHGGIDQRSVALVSAVYDALAATH
jgi:CubicO group peptidase (beta-lactamase class C family)